MMDEAHPNWEGSTYKPTSGSDPIRCYRELPKSEYDCGYDGPGWYFWEETWCYLHGPFGTIEECRDALNKYCETI